MSEDCTEVSQHIVGNSFVEEVCVFEVGPNATAVWGSGEHKKKTIKDFLTLILLECGTEK